MVKPVPIRFNPDALARDGVRYKTQVPLAHFPRLNPLLEATGGELHASFTFSRRREHIAVIGRMVVDLPLVCQRCMSAMIWSVDEAFELVFVDSMTAANRLPDELDPVVLDEKGQIHVVDLFEDELLLHVPAVPQHADERHCDPVGVQRWQALHQAASEPAVRRNPFEVLKDIDL